MTCLFQRLALFAISLAAAVAQVDTGTISGIVTDSSGAIVPGASVTATQQETNVRVTLSTNESGFYSAPGLRPGLYDVAVTNGIEYRVGVDGRNGASGVV